MAREYKHMKALEPLMLEMRQQGKSRIEIAEHFGMKKEQVKNWISRYNKAQRLAEAGIEPRRRGRPPKGYKPTEQEKENEIKRLRMENELLRSFLRHTGRR
ncbi:MAG: helix-turn-helix domain-containing protein [Defluviitaleaceae bacterium]|nr:helix-turn-helix domain-containing protein [Defluviitaleaceae bacterium]